MVHPADGRRISALTRLERDPETAEGHWLIDARFGVALCFVQSPASGAKRPANSGVLQR